MVIDRKKYKKRNRIVIAHKKTQRDILDPSFTLAVTDRKSVIIIYAYPLFIFTVYPVTVDVT